MTVKPGNDRESIQAEYRNRVLEWDAARANAAEANLIFSSLHQYYKEIRDQPSGLDAIEGLLNDCQVVVRLAAATHTLAFNPDSAQAVLVELAEDKSSVYGMDAKWTLRSWRSGKLNLDW